jgi:hypothetical protein
VHGFGQSVFGDPDIPEDSSMSEFLKGNLQDISAGVEITRPIGNRLAATAERNAMVAISRENAILEAQQLQVSHEVTSALAEIERCLRAVQTSEERVSVAQRAYENLTAKFEEGISISKESVLESKRTVVELELGADIARVDYSIALASLSVAQGTLLNEVAIFCGSESSMANYPTAWRVSTSPASLAQNPTPTNMEVNDVMPVVTLGRPVVSDYPTENVANATESFGASSSGIAAVSLSPPQVDALQVVAPELSLNRLATPINGNSLLYR